MYVLIICRKRGYSIERLVTYDDATARFYAVMNESGVTTAQYYNERGEQINAYHNTAHFPNK